MDKKFRFLKLFLPFVLLIVNALSSHAQVNQEYISELKTTSANINSAMALINLPELLNNSAAIIIASPVGNTKSMNPHPTGAWFYSGKWYVFNSDFAPMIAGLTFKITYYIKAGTDQYLHFVTTQNLGSDGSYLNHPALNNHPNAQFSFFQNHSPSVRTNTVLNPNDEKVGFNAASGKWYITNINGQQLKAGAAYNIVITPLVALVVTPTLINGTLVNTTATNPTNNSTTQPCNCPASLPPNGLSGGDLVGPYPDPMVRKILGRPLSNTPPQIGQVLKWNGNEWGGANDSVSNTNGATYSSGTGLTLTGSTFSALTNTPVWNANQLQGLTIAPITPDIGQVLKWNGNAWAPANDNVGNNPGSATIKTYTKYTSNSQGVMEAAGVEAETKIPSISGLVITVTVPSTLVISASCYARANCPAIGSCPLNIEFYYKVNDNSTNNFSYAGAEYLTAVISNHFYDVPAGTYTIDFYSKKRRVFSQLSYSAAGGYATVMVLPK